MKREKPLSELYRMYTAGKLERKNLDAGVFKYLLENFERYNVFNGNWELWEEFLSWVYPRLSRAIDQYRDIGSSFDSYITCLIHSSSREYRSREEDHRIIEFSCWRARAEEMEVREAEPEYLASEKELVIPKGVKRKQILLLLLKSYNYVNDEMIEQAARLTGMASAVILFFIEKLKVLRSGYDDEIFSLRERLHSQHYRCLAYHRRMNAAVQGTAYHEKMKGRLERARKRYYALKKRLDNIRKTAPNRMIADVLGIPKGTVDCSMVAIKKRLASGGNGAVWQ